MLLIWDKTHLHFFSKKSKIPERTWSEDGAALVRTWCGENLKRLRCIVSKVYDYLTLIFELIFHRSKTISYLCGDFLRKRQFVLFFRQNSTQTTN